MSRLYCLIVGVLISLSISGQEDSKVLELEFVYGNVELDSFVLDNFVRPYECIENGIEYNINLSFIVDSFGNVINVDVLKITPITNSKSTGYKSVIESTKEKVTKEAIRVVKFTSGLWQPREVGGKTENAAFTYLIKVKTPEFFNGMLNNIYQTIGSSTRVSTFLDVPMDNPVKYYNLGVKKISQKKSYIAIKYLKHSIGLGHRTKDVFYNLGLAYLFNDEKENACKSWKRAVSLGDTEAKVLINNNCK